MFDRHPNSPRGNSWYSTNYLLGTPAPPGSSSSRHSMSIVSIFCRHREANFPYRLPEGLPDLKGSTKPPEKKKARAK